MLSRPLSLCSSGTDRGYAAVSRSPLRARGVVRMEFWESVRRQCPGELRRPGGCHYQLQAGYSW